MSVCGFLFFIPQSSGFEKLLALPVLRSIWVCTLNVAQRNEVQQKNCCTCKLNPSFARECELFWGFNSGTYFDCELVAGERVWANFRVKAC